MRMIEGLRGAAIVAKGGVVESELAGGPADAESGMACAPATRFQICSISKQFAAAAVMLLAEAGAVALDEPVTRWLPQCGPQWRRVTLHHLLTHTAGVRHWGDEAGFTPSQPMELSERVRLLLRAPLLTAPGARWRYSSPGYLLVGQIVERAGGQPYADFLTERILAPLGMTSTTVGDVGYGDHAARGHRAGAPVPPWDLSAMPGTGDICSTVADLARFTTALHSGTLLADDSLRAMRAAHARIGDRPGAGEQLITGDAYGYGMFAGTVAGRAAYYHPGDNPGYLALAVWLPDRAEAVVILANDEACDVEDLLRRLTSPAPEK